MTKTKCAACANWHPNPPGGTTFGARAAAWAAARAAWAAARAAAWAARDAARDAAWAAEHAFHEQLFLAGLEATRG